MKIKTKLTLGVGLLFVMIILLTIIGIVQVRSLSKATEQILVANYNSLDYARNMLMALEEIQEDTAASTRFDHQLAIQEANITEIGEEEYTQRLRKHFDAFRTQPSDRILLNHMRQDIHQIMKLNLDAIQRKSQIASRTADQAILYLPAAGGLCFVIAFILLVNLPGHIANPIRELTESIRQIAAEKYTQRVHFEQHDEYGDLARSFNSMAKKLEEFNTSNLAKILMEKKRVEALINNMHDPVIGLDQDRQILFVNEEALQILGLPADMLIGRSAIDIALHHDLMRSLIREIGQPKKNPHPDPTLKIFAHGQESFFEKEIIPIQVELTGEDQPLHIGDVIVLRNITTFKQLDTAKTNFISTLSHEFKTPIAAIQMSLDLLRKEETGPLNATQQELILGMDDDAARLLRITTEILNMSQVESGQMQLQLTMVDPVTIVDRAVHVNRVQATHKAVQIHTYWPDQPLRMKADSDKSTWILSNLISNAIRHSHEGASIWVRIIDEGPYIRFDVEDTGQGIAPQYVGRIFERYFRIPGSSGEGSGLGLSISKQLIESMQGRIQVKSELGAGSTFSFWIPAME